MIETIYAKEPFPERMTLSIFLAGPTPRSSAVASWRPEALRVLERLGYDGAVFIPEDRGGEFRGSYLDQVEWEREGLRRADCILFWIPRDLEVLPGFTTNVEIGLWARSGKVVLGAPPDAPKLRYLRQVAEWHSIPSVTALEDAAAAALALIGPGVARAGAECRVPAHIFRSPSFQSWYGAQRGAGNVLESAVVEWTLRAGPERDQLFYWALHVQVFVAAEQRSKTNEVVLARPDIAAVVLYRRDAADPGATEVALVREFRSAVATADAYVRELPGGSSWDPTDSMVDVAVDEVSEEAHFSVAADRLQPVGVRQLMATMSAHRAHVFACELSAAEMDELGQRAGIAGGVGSERTYVEIHRVRDLFAQELTDWGTLGMIAAALGV